MKLPAWFLQRKRQANRGCPSAYLVIVLKRVNLTMSQQLFDIAVAQAEAEVEPDTVGNNFRWEMMAFVGIGRRLCVHVATMPHWPRAGQLGRLS
jgi:hypothetical protein